MCFATTSKEASFGGMGIAGGGDYCHIVRVSTKQQISFVILQSFSCVPRAALAALARTLLASGTSAREHLARGALAVLGAFVCCASVMWLARHHVVWPGVHIVNRSVPIARLSICARLDYVVKPDRPPYVYRDTYYLKIRASHILIERPSSPECIQSHRQPSKTVTYAFILWRDLTDMSQQHKRIEDLPRRSPRHVIHS